MLIGTGTAMPPPGTDTPVRDTCMFCRPCRFAMFTPCRLARFWMLMLVARPGMLAMLTFGATLCGVSEGTDEEARLLSAPVGEIDRIVWSKSRHLAGDIRVNVDVMFR